MFIQRDTIIWNFLLNLFSLWKVSDRGRISCSLFTKLSFFLCNLEVCLLWNSISKSTYSSVLLSKLLLTRVGIGHLCWQGHGVARVRLPGSVTNQVNCIFHGQLCNRCEHDCDWTTCYLHLKSISLPVSLFSVFKWFKMSDSNTR